MHDVHGESLLVSGRYDIHYVYVCYIRYYA